MSFQSDVLSLDLDGPVATLWLDRPEARNAMGPAFFADLPRAMSAVSADRDVRAISQPDPSRVRWPCRHEATG